MRRLLPAKVLIRDRRDDGRMRACAADELEKVQLESVAAAVDFTAPPSTPDEHRWNKLAVALRAVAMTAPPLP